MRLRTVTRAAAVGTLATLAAASWLTWVAPPAQALEREGLVIGQDEVVEAEYGPVVANNPANAAHTPAECRVQAYCDSIPLEVVVPPGITEEEEYFIHVLLEWETRQAPPDPVLSPEGYALNDMDMFIYTDPPTAEEAEARGATPESEGDPYVANGASGGTPEQAFMFKPKGKYWINIVNFIGANTGFKLKLTWVSESFPSPFEKLAPEFSPPTTEAPRRPSSNDNDLDRTPVTFSPTPTPTFDTTPSSLPTADIADDDDFDAGEFDTSDFEDELAAPAPVELEPIAARPDPPSNLALFFWLLAVPLGIIAIGGALITRRRATL